MSRFSMRRAHLIIPLVLTAVAGCNDSIPAISTGPLETPGLRFSAFPGANGRIAFTKLAGGIGTMNPDGSDVQSLTSDGRAPAWSADGSKIAFESNSDGDNEIYVMNADGTGRTQLTSNSSDDSAPTWSPDGSRIAFSTTRDGIGRIYVMNPDGSDPVSLTSRVGDGHDNLPSWSPNGAKIAFTSTRGAGFSQIYVMNADGTDQTALTTSSDGEYDPRWSPDGSKIAFTHVETLTPQWDIYVMNASGSGVANLTMSPTFNEATPAWSPDGSKIAYISNRGGNSAIYSISPDGSNEAAIPNSAAGVYLDWQPKVASGTCVFGPTTYTREQGPPGRFVENFTAAPGSYIVDLDDLASSGADATVKLNGVIIMDGRGSTGEVGPRHKTVAVTLTANNVLDVNIRGKKGSVLRVKICSESASACYPNLPAPQLTLQSHLVSGGRVEFDLDVTNYAEFPDELFAQAPDLEACGLTTNASRSWIDIYDGNGVRQFGFCALPESSAMNGIWFSTTEAEWPEEAYITITDRRCNITYTSNRINLAEFL